MSDYSDKKLGDIDGLDVVAHERSRGSRNDGGPRRPSDRRERPQPVRTLGLWQMGSVLLWLLLVLMGVWLYREVTIIRSQYDRTLDDSSQQLVDLASQLSATDETLNQSAGQIAETLKSHDSEIRKLWGVSNDRNKKWIQDLQSSVAALDKQRGQLSKSVESLRAEMKSLQGGIKQMETTRNQLQTRIDLMTDTVKQLESRLLAQQKSTEALIKLKPQLDALARLQSQGEGLDVRLAELEAAINAVDAYRREVNVRLDKLEGR